MRPAPVLFALGGVLAGYDHGARLAVLAQRTGTSTQAARRALRIDDKAANADGARAAGPGAQQSRAAAGLRAARAALDLLETPP